jgi:hypothetical protein
MASYTDQIPKFNPYIQQLPIEAMVQVGMEKQRRYDEGLQKIQTNIDNIAGLDVVRDVDKNYLQSKLNDLGSKLKTVAAGDFSNYQLVNSVGGMAKQIGKDATVQNAVRSTAWYRKQAQEMEKAISEGKSSQANILDFNEKASYYLNSDDVNASFSGRYSPYIDLNKKAMEAIKALHPKLQGYDIPFKIVNGKIDTTAIADAMQRYKIEGIDENQIQQAINATLTPDDINQLGIDARYQFRGVDSNRLVSVAETNYDLQKRAAVKELAFLQQQKGIVSNPTEASKITDRIAEYERILGLDGKTGILDENLSSQINLAKNDPNAAKLSIYKDGFVKEFANAFSWKNQEMQIVASPIKAQENWVYEQKRKAYEFGENIKIDKAQLKVSQDKLLLDAEANALKRAELYGDPNATDWTSLGNPTDNELNSPELFSTHVSSVDSSINSDRERLKTKYSDAQINEMLADWQNAQGVVSKAKKVKPNALKLIQNIAKNSNYLKSLNTLDNDIRTQADKEAGIDDIVNSATTGRGSLSFTTKKGERITLTPKELLGISSAWKTQTVPSGELTSEQDYIDESSLNANQRKAVKEIYTHLSGTTSDARQEAKKILKSYMPSAQKLKEGYAISEKIYKEKLAPLAQQFVPQIKAVSASKDGSPPPIIISRLSQLLTATDYQKIAGDENFSLEKASNMLLAENAKDTRVFIHQDGDNYQVHLKSESNPSERQVIKLTKNDVYRYFGAGYVNEKTQESIKLRLGRGNTNLTGDPLGADMQKQFGDFPGINSLQVTADLNEDLSDPSLFTFMINVKKKDGRYQTFELAGPRGDQRVGYDQGKQNLNSMTDEILLKQLKQAYPTFDFSTLDY